MNNDAIHLLERLKYNAVQNYILPGLTSWLVGKSERGGCIRLFEATRHQSIKITPHSHRFDLHSTVLRGQVKNTVWHANDSDGSEFFCSLLKKKEGFSEFEVVATEITKFTPTEEYYSRGSEYFMRSDVIHSIEFEPDTLVLVIEGPPVSDMSLIIEPYVNGKQIPTFRKEKWMFNG